MIDQTNPSIAARLILPVAPEVRARTLLTQLWRTYDLGGTSLGRSYEAVLLEAAMDLLGPPDLDEMARLDVDSAVVLGQTRDYLSAVRATKYGLRDPHPKTTQPEAP